jgi:hypothetical protein
VSSLLQRVLRSSDGRGPLVGTQAVGPPPEDTFAWAWAPWWSDPARYPEDLAWLREAVAGRPLVDLGSGRACLARSLAAAVGAEAYVGVDVAHGGGGAHDPRLDLHARLPPLPPPSPEGLEVVRVRCDALAFARLLVPGAACVLVGGLDRDVIPSSAWHEALAAAIAAALGEDGIVLWTESACASGFDRVGLVRRKHLRLLAEIAARDAVDGGGWLGSGLHCALLRSGDPS